MWEIKLRKKESYNCFQNMIYTIASYYDTNYKMMMLELLTFKYLNKTKGAIGNKLTLGWTGNLSRRNTLLDKFHGFGFFLNKDKDNLISKINENLLLSPVGLYIDSFLCNWLPYYGIQHRSHICLLIGQDKNNYLFIDEFCEENEINKVTKDFVEKNCKEYLTFYKSPINEVNVQDYITEINRVVENYFDGNKSEQYGNFIYDMVNNLELSVEIPNDNNPIESKLIMYLKNMSEDRLNFIEAINYIEMNSDLIFNKIKKDLFFIASEYEKLRAYLIKCCFTRKKPEKFKIESKLTLMFELEKQLLINLKNICLI